MRVIDNDIKAREFKKAYILYGSERYLLLQYRDKLLKALVAPDDTMNFTRYEGNHVEVTEVIDLAETMPFLAEYRVILIEDSGWFKKEGTALAEYLPDIPDNTILIFAEKEVDKRSKLYKTAQKVGYICEFATQTEETLQRWILSRLKREERTITQEAYQLFINKTGTDMENIDRELEKLVCYTIGRTNIEIDDVMAITTEQTQNKIFDMVDAITAHNERKALDLYYDLLALKEAPMRIMYLITQQFHRLSIVKSMSGFNNKEIAAKAGCPEWAVRKYQAQCKDYSLDTLKQAIKDGTAYETAVKTGQLADHLAVELFIVQYSKKK